MIKYAVVPEKKIVYAILSNTRHDAIRKIERIIGDDSPFCAYSKKYMMPNEYRVVVQCDERDEFIPEVGMKIAKQRILDRYYAALDKRVNKFFDAALIFNGKVFETPKELENNT